MLRQGSLAISHAALFPSSEPEPKLMVVHNKNEERQTPKDANLESWQRQHIIPWSALLDFFIVLLYVFFALTYQSAKIRFFLRFQEVFDTYFMSEAEECLDGLVFLHFKDEIIDVANSTTFMFFDFPADFPSQDPFTQSSNVFLSLDLVNGSSFEYEITSEMLEENPDFVADLFTETISLLDAAEFESQYLLTRETIDNVFYTEMTYDIYLTQVERTGIVQWESNLVAKDRSEDGKVVLSNQISALLFPIALVIVDSFAILLTILRFIAFLRHAREYAEKNYVRLIKALLWKMDIGELFNLFYQVLTLISVVLYILYVNSDFGGQQGLLIFLSSAAFLHCIGLFRHLKMKEETWFVARLIFRSMGRTLLFVLGFVPFYYAWTILGISLFGHFSYLFKGFLRTLKVMFSMMHTDVCMDTQEALKDEAAAPHQLVTSFVVSWLMLTGGMVINILIAIVENTLEELIIEDNKAT